MPHNKDILQKIKVLPNKPGIYKYFDEQGKIIYVGKARNLKKRVSSYFTKTHESFKTHLMVSKIANIEHIVLDNESDALLLENNLIKELQPKYNVLLKDDKTFPWLCVSNEAFPRIFYTRNIIKDGSEYYGPYTSVYTLKTVISLIRQIYQIRTCRLKLTESNIKSGKFDVCLEYHIGNCKAPCVGKQSESEYLKDIEQAKRIIKGDLASVLKFLKAEMAKYAKELKFEEAESLKSKIEIVENYRVKSTIVNPKIKNVDVFGIAEDSKSAFVNYLKVIDGAVINAHTIEIKKRLDESKTELLLTAIIEMRQRTGSGSKEIIVSEQPEFCPENANYLMPQRGDKKKLLELSERNAKLYMLEKHKQQELKDPTKSIDRKLETLKKDLRMEVLPKHIECFDNSNIQGSSPVAACVVFRDTKPSKKEYRHYHIKTVTGPDDFASMKEIIFRRYKRLIDEKAALPQLIIIDGGKGQLNAALASLKKLGIANKTTIIGIAKKLEEIYFPDDPVPLYIDKNSESLKIIRHARDEAHRFGISFHRNIRSKKMILSELNNIKGIGNKTAQILLKEFGSVESIKKANFEKIRNLIGKKKAEIISSYFNNTN
ncbi:MAG: excinuclease ABC subunit UvrC [Bacteroidales bacterium]|nr:excinuclease ABC subunit UvrC [Bacteroidales bacterium]